MTTPRKDCKKCMHAVVGRHQLCRCEMGHWEAVPLADMPRHNWLRDKSGVDVDLVRAKHGGWETERI